MFLVSLLVVGCGGGSSSTPHDAAVDVVAFTLPDLPPGCPPKTGNENGIGTPCTATGTECTGTLQCSCKNWFGYAMPASMPCFCTNVSFGAQTSGCGSNAAPCTYDIPINGSTIAISACFPSVCLVNNQCPAIQ